MTLKTNTLEIAKLYESQGYDHQAYEMYKALDQEHSTSQTRAGINRMEMKIATAAAPVPESEKQISSLIEQWLELIILQYRLNHFKKIKSRLV